MSGTSEPLVEEAVRRHLLGVAYRLLGSVTEAEDAVQEGYSRWFGQSPAQRSAIDNPTAWLTTVIGRICLDVLKSARVHRESYVGPWLPEPLPEDAHRDDGAALRAATADPLDRISWDESVSMAVLVVLERLTSAQRVSLVLHDVFGFSFAELADMTGRSAGACRELASQARRKVRSGRRTQASRDDLARAVAAFKVAWETGDVSVLVGQLSTAAVATIDGGGKVSASLEPLNGAVDVARFLLAVHERQPDLILRESLVNAAPGVIAVDGAGTVLATISLALDDVGISRLWVVRNPEKLVTWNPSPDFALSRDDAPAG